MARSMRTRSRWGHPFAGPSAGSPWCVVRDASSRPLGVARFFFIFAASSHGGGNLEGTPKKVKDRCRSTRANGLALKVALSRYGRRKSLRPPQNVSTAASQDDVRSIQTAVRCGGRAGPRGRAGPPDPGPRSRARVRAALDASAKARREARGRASGEPASKETTRVLRAHGASGDDGSGRRQSIGP